MERLTKKRHCNGNGQEKHENTKNMLSSCSELSANMEEINKVLQKVAMNSEDYKGVKTVSPYVLESSVDFNNNGWDTVFAIRANILNKAIVTKKTSPTNFEASIVEEEITYAIRDGLFGDWQMAEGGDGENVNMLIPLVSGTYISPSGNQITLAGSKFMVQVKLNYVYKESKRNKAVITEGDYELKVKTNEDTTECFQLQSSKAVFIVGTEYPEGISDTNKYIITGIMDQWLNENIGAFNQVFTTVYLEKLSSTTEFGWLKPTFISYAYLDGPTMEESLFAVLCMTNNNSPVGLTHQLHSIPIGKENSSCFIVSTEIYMEECLVPKLEEVYQEENVAFTKENRIIYAENFKMPDVRVGLINYTPKVLEFRMEFNPSSIDIMQRTTVNISAGIDAYITLTMKQGLRLETNDKNEQIMSYVNIGEPKVQTDIKVSPYIVLTQAIIALIISIGSIIVTNAVKETKRMIVAIIVAIITATITGIVILVTNIVSKGIATSMPSVLPLINAGTRNIKWPLYDMSSPDRYVLKEITYRNEIAFFGDPGIQSSGGMV